MFALFVSERSDGFERTVGELAGTWLDLGANSVSGNISIMRRGTPATAGAANAAAGSGAGDGEASA